ncbi:MAG TPA: DUF3300 domain-containing protein, partial [Xanthomonadales bacterium]|nr:DUF3300 domain-containing protein [Xanthomonadales bacterium]
MRSFKTLIFTAFVALAGLVSVPVSAQQAEAYSQAELEQMLAPIALYPDTVLSHVLIAATYPLEVVQAARWSRNNPGYSGQDAVAMVENQDWDPSVKALVAFPELLDRMDQDIGWTQGLGDAFLVQEGEVTDTIQYLRNQAYNNGQLQSNAQVNVVRETRYIYIEPAQPQVVYVPYYDPYVVYGPWRWAAYPPVYWHHPPGFSLSLGFYWGAGIHLQSSFFFSSFYWPSRHVVVVDHHYHNRYRDYGYGGGHGHYRPGHHMAHYDGARRWQHSPQHRRGVSYRGNVSQDRFSQRDDGRGRGDNYRGDMDQDRFGRRDEGRSRDHSAPVRTAQVRENQRDWAERQRTRLVDNADKPQRGDHSRNRYGADTSRGRNRSADRDRSGAPVDTPVAALADTLAANTARDGRQRTRDSASYQRPAPLDSARNEGRVRPERNTERARELLANAGNDRRANRQPDASRNTPRTNQAEFIRSVRSAAAPRQAEPQRQAAASRQAEPQRQAAASRQGERQRQAAAP